MELSQHGAVGSCGELCLLLSLTQPPLPTGRNSRGTEQSGKGVSAARGTSQHHPCLRLLGCFCLFTAFCGHSGTGESSGKDFAEHFKGWGCSFHAGSTQKVTLVKSLILFFLI